MPKPNDVTRALRRARARITPPERWLVRQLAVAVDGQTCPPGHPLAGRWCAVGALMEEYTTATGGERGYPSLTFDRDAYTPALERLEACLPDDWLGGVEGLNDQQGHDAVLALYDAAIRGK